MPVAPLREAVERVNRAGSTWAEISIACGYGPSGSTTLKRVLGIEARKDVASDKATITEETALRIIDALCIAPVEVGL